MTWQPIDTAPRDGTPVLLYDPTALTLIRPQPQIREWRPPRHVCQLVGAFNGHAWVLVHHDGLLYDPTRWMPLPDPPTA